jgi:hypothetical protein
MDFCLVASPRPSDQLTQHYAFFSATAPILQRNWQVTTISFTTHEGPADLFSNRRTRLSSLWESWWLHRWPLSQAWVSTFSCICLKFFTRNLSRNLVITCAWYVKLINVCLWTLYGVSMQLDFWSRAMYFFYHLANDRSFDGHVVCSMAIRWWLQNWGCQHFHCEWNFGVPLCPAVVVFSLGCLV